MQNFDFAAYNEQIHGEKLWYIVYPEDRKDLEDALGKFITDHKMNFKNCKYPLRSKQIYVGPAFFKKNGIRYSEVKTKPGDILLIKEGVYHSGGCLTVPCCNLAGNTCGIDWVKTAQQTDFSCSCETCKSNLDFYPEAKILKELLNPK